MFIFFFLSTEFWGLPQQFLEKTQPLYELYLTTLLTLQNTISTQKALKVPSEVAAAVWICQGCHTHFVLHPKSETVLHHLVIRAWLIIPSRVISDFLVCACKVVCGALVCSQFLFVLRCRRSSFCFHSASLVRKWVWTLKRKGGKWRTSIGGFCRTEGNHATWRRFQDKWGRSATLNQRFKDKDRWFWGEPRDLRENSLFHKTQIWIQMCLTRAYILWAETPKGPTQLKVR